MNRPGISPTCLIAGGLDYRTGPALDGSTEADGLIGRGN